MTKRQIIKRYENLKMRVATDSFYRVDLTNRVNCYICTQCNHITKTKDVDAGVTPYITSCETCEQPARSTFYVNITDSIPTKEWYRPTIKEVLEIKNNLGLIDHILNGGLISRKISISHQ